MKPTSTRFTYEGIIDAPGFTIPSERAKVFGPISNNVENLERGLRAFFIPAALKNQEFLKAGNRLAWDASRVQKVLQKKRLKFGIIRRFTEFGVCKAQARALDEVIQKLEADGHEVVSFDSTLDEFSKLFKCSIQGHFNPKKKIIDEVMKGEKLIPEASLGNVLSDTPFFVKSAISKLLLRAGEKRFHDLLQMMKGGSIAESLGQVRKNCFETREKIFGRYRELELDALITPGMPVPAFKHGKDFKSITKAFRFLIHNSLFFCF